MISFTPEEIEKAIKSAYEHNSFNEDMFWSALKNPKEVQEDYKRKVIKQLQS